MCVSTHNTFSVSPVHCCSRFLFNPSFRLHHKSKTKVNETDNDEMFGYFFKDRMQFRMQPTVSKHWGNQDVYHLYFTFSLLSLRKPVNCGHGESRLLHNHTHINIFVKRHRQSYRGASCVKRYLTELKQNYALVDCTSVTQIYRQNTVNNINNTKREHSRERKLCQGCCIIATWWLVVVSGMQLLRSRSAIRRHHPPQRAVPSQICLFGKRKVVLFQILLDGAEPRNTGTT